MAAVAYSQPAAEHTRSDQHTAGAVERVDLGRLFQGPEDTKKCHWNTHCSWIDRIRLHPKQKVEDQLR